MGLIPTVSSNHFQDVFPAPPPFLKGNPVDGGFNNGAGLDGPLDLPLPSLLHMFPFRDAVPFQRFSLWENFEELLPLIVLNVAPPLRRIRSFFFGPFIALWCIAAQCLPRPFFFAYTLSHHAGP